LNTGHPSGDSAFRTRIYHAAPTYEPIAKFPIKVEGGVIHARDDRWN
jgi:hypothetical protein